MIDIEKLYFTSDLHFDHESVDNEGNKRGILIYCPARLTLGPTIQDMNRALCELWNDTVPEDGVVLVLGDVGMSRRHLSVPYLQYCRGTKYLWPGNHDNCWAPGRDGNQSKHFEKHCRDYMEWGQLAGIIQPPTTLQLGEFEVTLSHMPDKEAGDQADHSEELRFEHLRPPHDPNKWMFCGHVHQAWQLCERRINVGVDVWNFAPVAATRLLSVMRKCENVWRNDR